MLVRNFDGKPSSQMGSGRKRRKQDFRSSIITERFLTMFLKVLSYSKTTKRNVLYNFKKFLTQVNASSYEKDPNVFSLLMAINIVLKNKLDGVTEKEDLIEYVNLEIMDNYEDQKENIIFPTILSSDETTEKESTLVMGTIDKYIRYESVLEMKDSLADALTDIGSGNISNLEESLDELRGIISTLNDEFKKTDIAKEAYSFSHTTEEDDFRELLAEAHAYAVSAKMCLKTGLKRFNEMLSMKGGFLGGKVYMFYADTNTFKSALLKYCKKWIQKYNGEMFKEEFLATGKRPTILYISLEDGEKEDISRIFTTYTGKDLMAYEDMDEVDKLWRAAYTETGSIIDITQVNSADKPINLSTIDGFIKRLEEENYFVIAVIVDSFDLMAPSDDDIYRGITDETTLMGNRAKAIQKWIADKPFPWITAHQLNRAGNQAIMEKKDKGCVDIAKSLGRSFISGAYDIERRVHFSAFIYTEWCKFDNEIYLEIKRDKVKYKKTPIDYLVCMLENGFVIHDDYGTDQYLCRDSIIPKEEDYSQGASDVGSRGITSIARMKQCLGTLEEPPKEETKPTMMSSSSCGATPQQIQAFIYATQLQFIFDGFNPYTYNKPIRLSGQSSFKYTMVPDEYAVTPFNMK